MKSMTGDAISGPDTVIRDFFDGKNTRDFARALSGFSPSSVVRDEKLDHRGPVAIRAWMEETAARYDDRAELLTTTNSDDGVEVVARVFGNFPGSPVDLRFKFTLNGGQIRRLEIVP